MWQACDSSLAIRAILLTMERLYRSFIFSNHAMDRLDLRSITQNMVVETLQHPEITKPGDKRNTTKFIKTVHGRRMHVVASYLEKERQWLIISVWVRGENDRVPLVWQIITLPFRVVWYITKKYLLHIE